MKIVIRANNEFTDGEKIQSIEGLENFIIIELERGDKMKKIAKKAKTVFGRKNTYSVLALRNAIEIATQKATAQTGDKYGVCAVCGDMFSINQMNENSVCRCCDLI